MSTALNRLVVGIALTTLGAWNTSGVAAQQHAEVPGAGAPVAAGSQAPVSPADLEREVLVARVRQVVRRDEFVERATGILRSAGNFAALKKALVEVYSDPVLLDWMASIALQHRADPAGFEQEIAARSQDAVLRTTDGTILRMLRPIGTMFGRFSAHDCATFGAAVQAATPLSALGIVFGPMHDGEVREYLLAWRDAMLDAIANKPRRLLPEEAEVELVFARLDAMLVRNGGAQDNECRVFSRMLPLVEQLDVKQRSIALTYMIAIAGSGAGSLLQRLARASRQGPLHDQSPLAGVDQFTSRCTQGSRGSARGVLQAG